MFRITNGKGFHITFENGYTASVQWGGGNYCSNHSMVLPWGAVEPSECVNAEIAYWAAEGKMGHMGGDTVAGYKSPAEVLAFLNMVAALPKV